MKLSKNLIARIWKEAYLKPHWLERYMASAGPARPPFAVIATASASPFGGNIPMSAKGFPRGSDNPGAAHYPRIFPTSRFFPLDGRY